MYRDSIHLTLPPLGGLSYAASFAAFLPDSFFGVPSRNAW